MTNATRTVDRPEPIAPSPELAELNESLVGYLQQCEGVLRVAMPTIHAWREQFNRGNREAVVGPDGERDLEAFESLGDDEILDAQRRICALLGELYPHSSLDD